MKKLIASIFALALLSATAGNAGVGVGIHIGGVGAGVHVGVGNHYYHRAPHCVAWNWRHHQHYCVRWSRW